MQSPPSTSYLFEPSQLRTDHSVSWIITHTHNLHSPLTSHLVNLCQDNSRRSNSSSLLWSMRQRTPAVRKMLAPSAWHLCEAQCVKCVHHRLSTAKQQNRDRNFEQRDREGAFKQLYQMELAMHVSCAVLIAMHHRDSIKGKVHRAVLTSRSSTIML